MDDCFRMYPGLFVKTTAPIKSMYGDDIPANSWLQVLSTRGAVSFVGINGSFYHKDLETKLVVIKPTPSIEYKQTTGDKIGSGLLLLVSSLVLSSFCFLVYTIIKLTLFR